MQTGLKFVFALVLAGTATAGLAQASRSVWDGVYSADQAARGKTAFDASCAKCHGATLGGNEMAPALSGASFLDNWNGLAVADLVERIHSTMPADNPGSLSRKSASDIAAYILSANQIPAGTAEMPADAQIQTMLHIEASKPAN